MKNPIKIPLQPHQYKAFKHLIPNDRLVKEVLFGGAKGGGKSSLGTIWLLSMAWQFPETYYFVARAELNDLRKYTLPSFYESAGFIGMPKDFINYQGSDNYIYLNNDSRIYFIACKYLPSDPMFERFGSMQHTAGWMEEAGEIEYIEAYENLKKTTGRWNNVKYNIPAKLLITCNPKKNWIYKTFYKPYKNNILEDTKKFIRALPTDNKFLDKEYIKTLETGTKRDIQRLRYGEWDYDDSDNALVSFDKISDLFHNTFVQKTGKRMLSCDIALLNDKSVLIAWDGMVIIGVKVYHKLTSEQLKNNIIETAKQYEVPNSNIIYDGDGIGLYLNGLIPGALKFNNNGASGLPEFSNIKTRLAYMLADAINKGKIFIDCVLPLETKELIVEDLQCLKAKDSERKMELITKDDMKKIIGRSPDFLDAIMYRMFFIISRHY